MENKKWCVYMHTFPNDKKYIGITVVNEGQNSLTACKKRWGKDGYGYHTQRVWQAIRKYGWSNVKHEILFENIAEEKIDELEKSLIEKYNCQIDNGNGYNIDFGGKHRIVSDYTKEKLSKSLSGENHPNYGKHLSKDTKRRIAEAQIGKYVSEETREKIRKAQTWQKGENNPNYGKHWSKEIREKISNGLSGKYKGEKSYWYGKHLSDEAKEKLRRKALERYKDITNHPNYGKSMSENQKIQISDRNSNAILVFNLLGNYICEYKSATKCAEHYNVIPSAVCNNAKGNSLVFLNNFILIYKKDFTDELLNKRLDRIKNTRRYKYLNFVNDVILSREQGIKAVDAMSMLGISRDMYYSCLKNYKMLQKCR